MIPTYFVLDTCSVGTYPVGAISVGVCTFYRVGNIFIFENENQFSVYFIPVHCNEV